MSVTVTRDEADKRREELQGKRREASRAGDAFAAQTFDPSALRDADQAYRYRWINKHPSRISRYKSAGYEVVPENDRVSSVIGDEKGDGGKRLNDDMILMRTPKQNYEARLQRIKQRGELWEKAGREQAIERINRIARDGHLAKEHQDVAFDESGRR